MKKRLLGNAMANLFANVVNVAWQLGAIPVFLAFWNSQRYGEWLLLSAIPSYLSLADAGLTTVSANEMSMFVADGKTEFARRSLHTAFGFLLLVAAVLVILCCAGSFLLPLGSWLNLTAPKAEVRWAAFFLSLYALFGLWFALFSSIYRAEYRAARGTVLVSSSRIIELVATAVGLSLSDSFANLAGWLCATRLLVCLILWLDCRHLSSALRPGLSSFSFDELRRIWKPSILFMAFPLGNALYFQGLTLVAGRMLGPVEVVVFNTTRTLTRAVVQVVTLIKHSTWPEFSYLFGARDFERARRLNGLAFEATAICVFFFTIVLGIFGGPLVRIWTGGSVLTPSSLLLLLLLSAAVNSLWFVGSGLIMGVNRHKSLAFYYAAISGLAVLAAIPLVHWFGLDGLGLTMLIAELTLLPLALAQTCALLEQSVFAFLSRAVRFSEIRSLLRSSRFFSRSSSTNVDVL